MIKKGKKVYCFILLCLGFLLSFDACLADFSSHSSAAEAISPIDLPYMNHDFIVPLEPEQAMSTPTYDPFGTETTYKIKLELCQNGS